MVRYRVSLPSGLVVEDPAHASSLCKLIEQRIYEKLSANRQSMLAKLHGTPTGDIFPFLPAINPSVLLGSMLCFLTHHEVVTLLPLVSRQMALLASCETSCFLLVRRLHIVATNNQVKKEKKQSWHGTEAASLTVKANETEQWHEQYALDEVALKASLMFDATNGAAPVVEVVPLECRPSQIHGTGTFATRAISMGEPIAIVTGELASNMCRDDNPGEHGFQLMNGRILTPIGADGEDRRSFVHFCNHSCLPNAIMWRLDIDHHATGCDLPYKRSSCTAEGLIPWMSKHHALRSVWKSFCLPLLKYKARPAKGGTHSRGTIDQIFVLCARNQDIANGEEITITYPSNGHLDGRFCRSASAMGRISLKYDSLLCGCSHSEADQHYMNGRYMNETDLEFGQRCFYMRCALQKADTTKWLLCQRKEVLHREHGALYVDRNSRRYTYDTSKKTKPKGEGI
jgi:hypothetical protein